METMPEERTQDNFNKLPGLLSRAEFKHWTGLSDEGLDASVKSGEIQSRKNGDRGYKKYFKWQAAEVGGFKL